MKALITNWRLAEFGGSELVALEVAEELQQMGWDVLLYSPFVGSPLVDTVTVPVTMERPNPNDFDLLWIHHNRIIHDLGFRKRVGQRLIFNHMSSYVDTEWPKLASYENELADVILANSEETRVRLHELGLKNVQLFQNPARRPSSLVEKVGGGLFVSNHRPGELMGHTGEYIGREKPTRITPDVIAKYDYVVCNGKTCQQALRAGVPVYLYDHFGGCGWLTEENFEKAEWHNFSGRGFGPKTGMQIAEELQCVPRALECPDRFKLEKVLPCLLGE